MAFEVARGAPLPWLAYLEAVGDLTTMAEVAEAARRALVPLRGRVHSHWIEVKFFFFLLRLVGRMDGAQARRWGRWLAERRDRTSDAVLDRDDPWPGVVDFATALFRNLRHPRSTWRQAREA
jgi:hypothetical protein